MIALPTGKYYRPASGSTMVYRVPSVSASSLSLGAANTSTQYYSMGGSSVIGTVTLANNETRIQTGGTIKNLRTQLVSNASTTAATLRVIKNGSPTSLTLTMTALTSGLFENITDSFTVAANDLLCYEVVRSSAESLNFGHIAFDILNADATTYNVCALPGGAAAAVASISRFTKSHGALSYSTAVNPSLAPTGFTAKNLSVFVSANARTSATTFTLRKNGSATAVTLSIPSSTSGWFMSSATETFAAGDTIDVEIVTGANAGTLTYRTLFWESTPTTTGRAAFMMGSVDTNFTTANSPRRTALGASQVCLATSGSSAHRLKVYGSGTLRNAYLYAPANSADAPIFNDIRNAGSNTGISVATTALTNGTYSDLTNTFNYVSGNTLELNITRSGLGAYTMGCFSYAADITQETL